jgi:hypothetical protein
MSTAAVNWISYVGHTYMVPQYNDMSWTPTRSAEESTYYVRDCSKEDLSTLDPSELFLPPDATVEDAYQHNLKHGFTVFRSVLSPRTANNLRDYVVAKNAILSEQESIFVIENANRYSFGLGTDEPVVAAAVKEVTTHPLLKQSMESIIGKSAALIEMTAITATAGAVDQFWHDDILPWGSPLRHARAFGPSYAIFIQVRRSFDQIRGLLRLLVLNFPLSPLLSPKLQNTTKEMGATGACPGTHYCSGGSETDMCGEEGFQLVNEEGYWATGDALLMNMNGFHRGSAHSDPAAPDRVMFILTFAPKPREAAESRRFSQGITFSLRWDMWGHTWDDLTRATELMNQPWATLRSLALYKPKGSAWGIDWFTGALMRIEARETGFNGETMEQFQEWGQLKCLPVFLQEQDLDPDDKDVWIDYATGTLGKVKSFMNLTTYFVIGVYGALSALAATFWGNHNVFFFPSVRVGIFTGLALGFYTALCRHVDSTQWAADIRGHRRYTFSMGSELAFGVKSQGITTLPHRNDVLIETRFGSRNFYMYNDFIDGHPGNRNFLSLVEAASHTFASYPLVLQEASARHIVESVLTSSSRFLEQGAHGAWYVNDFEEAMAYTKSVLVRKSWPVVGKILQELRYIISEFRFGKFRDTMLAQKQMAPFLKKLEKRIISVVLGESLRTERDLKSGDSTNLLQSKSPISPTKQSTYRPKSLVQLPRSHATETMRYLSSNQFVAKEPEPGAWFSTGSLVEVFTDGYWFIGDVDRVSPFAAYYVTFPDGGEDFFSTEFVRVFEPYHVGEEVQVCLDSDFDCDYEDCEIVSVQDDGTYNIILTDLEEDEDEDEDEYHEGISPAYFRRPLSGSPPEQKTYVAAYE